MRNLPSVNSASSIAVYNQFRLTPSDASTTFLFDHSDIVSISPLTSEVPFPGGFSKPVNYKIQIRKDPSFINANYTKFIRADGALRVYLNDDEFTPHIGKIRNLSRDESNPSLITFQVVDAVFDKTPFFPPTPLVNSYSTLNPEVFEADFGQGYYYGKHTRPIYFTPVDCHIDVLLGPKNVSSANHVSSIHFIDNLKTTESAGNFIIMEKIWNQQSASDNLATGGTFFHIKDLGADNAQIIKQRVNGASMKAYVLAKEGNASSTNFVTQKAGYTKIYDGWFPASSTLESTAVDTGVEIEKAIRSEIFRPLALFASFSNSSFVQYSGIAQYQKIAPLVHKTGFTRWVSVGATTGLGVLHQTTDTITGSIDFVSIGGLATTWLTKNSGVTDSGISFAQLALKAVPGTLPSSNFVITGSFHVHVQLTSDSYRNYSIFAHPVNPSEVAISENPSGIVADLLNQSSLSFVQAQNSQAQTDTSSFNFQCYFGEREDLTKTLDGIGRGTATAMWIGDSGSINFKRYQNSANGLEAMTIATSDCLSFRMDESPLGTGVFEKEKSSNISLKYNWNFQTKKYENTLSLNPLNSAACNSIAALGISNPKSFKTKHVIETDTASLMLGILAAKLTSEGRTVQLGLPARYFGLEVADVVKIQHPMLPNSESLFYVRRVTNDYLRGQVLILGEELVVV